MIKIKIVRFAIYRRNRGDFSPGVVAAVVDDCWDVGYRVRSGWVCSCREVDGCAHVEEVRAAIHPESLAKIDSNWEEFKPSPQRLAKNAAYLAKLAERERVLSKERPEWWVK